MEERPPTRAGGRRPASYGIPSAHNVGALPSLPRELMPPAQTGFAPAPTPSALLSPPSGATSSAGQQLSARVAPIIATASASSSSTAATCTGTSPRCPSTTAASHTLMAPLASPRYCATAAPPLPLAQGVPPPPPPPSVLASAPPFARRSNTLNCGTQLDSIGLPGEEHGAMFEALILEDDADAAACASEAVIAAAASLAVNVSVREAAAVVSSGAEATAPGDGATQARFVPRPPDTPPPPSMQGRASTSGVVDGGGGDFSSIIVSGGVAAAGEPPISPLLTHLRVQRRPTFTFGDKDGEGSGTGHAATPTTPSGGLAAIASGAISPASGGFGGGFGGAGVGGFVPASPRFARASTTIGISSTPLSTLTRGVPLLPGETPSDTAAFGAGMPWPTTAAAACASGGASGAATPTRGGGHVESPVNAGRKLLPPLQRAALHAQTASPRVSLTGAGSGGVSPAAAAAVSAAAAAAAVTATAAGNGPASANLLARSIGCGPGGWGGGNGGGGGGVPGLRAMSSSLTLPGSYIDLTCHVPFLVGEEQPGPVTPPGPSPAGGASGAAVVSSLALLGGGTQASGRALLPVGRNNIHSCGGGSGGRSSNDNADMAAGEAASASCPPLTPRGGTVSGPLPSLDAAGTAAVLAALASHPASSKSLLSQPARGDVSLSGASSQRPPLPYRRTLTEIAALEAS